MSSASHGLTRPLHTIRCDTTGLPSTQLRGRARGRRMRHLNRVTSRPYRKVVNPEFVVGGVDGQSYREAP